MGPDATGFVLLALIAYAAFHHWMRHRRRMMIHQERLAAIDKGADLPALDHEVHRIFNVQRILLFAGLVWVSLGTALFLVLWALTGQIFHFPFHDEHVVNGVYSSTLIWVPVQIRSGMHWIGVALVGIGLSHLAVYTLGRRDAHVDSRRTP